MTQKSAVLEKRQSLYVIVIGKVKGNYAAGPVFGFKD
jgi:hypothetical protein